MSFMAINLIPPKLKKEKEFRKTTGIFFVFLNMILIVLIIVTTTCLMANYFYKKDLKNIKNQINEQNLTLSKYGDLKKEVKTVNTKLDIINNIDATRVLWSNIIAELGRCTPVEVQIKTLSSKDNKISLTGTAATRRDIAKFKEKLESSKNFKNVIFTSSSLNEQSNDYGFDLNCEIEEIK